MNNNYIINIYYIIIIHICGYCEMMTTISFLTHPFSHNVNVF